MAHSYAHLYQLPITCLRFFTVYGPWGRPDMAYWTFTEKILRGEPLPLFNNGLNRRDFTYIDDVTEGIIKVLKQPAKANPAWDGNNPDPASSSSPWQVLNIGNHDPVPLARFVKAIERSTGCTAKVEKLPAQPGDVEATHANIDRLKCAINFSPSTTLEEGIDKFVKWYRTWNH